VLYVTRWLKAPMQLPDGTVVERVLSVALNEDVRVVAAAGVEDG
jgi:hypothetical protein